MEETSSLCALGNSFHYFYPILVITIAIPFKCVPLLREAIHHKKWSFRKLLTRMKRGDLKIPKLADIMWTSAPFQVLSLASISLLIATLLVRPREDVELGEACSATADCGDAEVIESTLMTVSRNLSFSWNLPVSWNFHYICNFHHYLYQVCCCEHKPARANGYCLWTARCNMEMKSHCRSWEKQSNKIEERI